MVAYHMTNFRLTPLKSPKEVLRLYLMLGHIKCAYKFIYLPVSKVHRVI